jgi:phosphoglycerol transferase MdoB-like AlkP superfamily enzyme
MVSIHKPFIRYFSGLFFVFLTLTLLGLLSRMVFMLDNWNNLSAVETGVIWVAISKGIRYDMSAAATLLVPVLFIWHLLAVSRARPLWHLIPGYLAFLFFVVPALAFADLLYFRESGNHFTYEIVSYLGPFALPPISAAWRMHPVLFVFLLVSCAVLSFAGALTARRLLRFGFPSPPVRHPFWLLTLPVFALLIMFTIRGGVKGKLTIGDSLISANPTLNAVCLNPVYSILRTSAATVIRFRFYDEKSNIDVVRTLIGCRGAPDLPRYPLFRESPGFVGGNRRNVVIFLLESWSAKDIGVLGGDPRTTPVFDSIAKDGVLFTRSIATGIRTPEGVFSILCSFPNQPVKPVMKQAGVHKTRWRSLGKILSEVGYETIFVHGRSLSFDHLDQFLKRNDFTRVIDRTAFPPSVSAVDDSWPGYHDEEVMKRANAEFASLSGRPFLGIIYTMNTHPPFLVPDRYPLLFPCDTEQHCFLNALHYSDYTLGSFFQLARKEHYFRNTIFIFVADHARTRDKFNYSSQHEIPLLIYAPGLLKPKRSEVVASQLDILPTILGLLKLKTTHASWGQDLLRVLNNDGFAVAIAGQEARWHDSHHLLNDALGWQTPLLFDLKKDPDCSRNIWREHEAEGRDIQRKLRGYISLSQTLFYENRVYPEPERKHR